MKLWVVRQDENNDYDTYDSMVVAAESEEIARMTHPLTQNWDGKETSWDCWCGAKYVTVEYLGETDREISGVVVSSYNAG